MTAAETTPSPSSASEQDAAVTQTRSRILVFELFLVVAAAAALSYFTHAFFKAELEPEVRAKSAALANFIAADFERALGYGIPIDHLAGVSAYLDAERARHQEIRFIALMGLDGKPHYVAGTYFDDPEKEEAEAAERQAISSQTVVEIAPASLDFDLVLAPVRVEQQLVAHVAISTDPLFVTRQIQELSYDVLVILLVALFLAFEVAVALLAVNVVTPMNQLIWLLRAAASGDLRRSISYRTDNEIGRAIRQFNDVIHGLNDRYAGLGRRLGDGVAPELRARFQAIGERFGLTANGTAVDRAPASAIDVRLPLFIFILAEELQKAFLPLYVRSLEGDISWLPSEVLIGLPITVYMATLAVATPFAGTWADRYGARRIFLAGLVPAIIGFVGSALATTVFDLILSRALTAVGYAMCTIAAQSFIIQVTVKQQRARGVSTFFGVLMSASICGTAVGGILAERIGGRAVFLCAAVLALIAGVLALRMLGGGVTAESEKRLRLRLADLRLLLRNWRFVALILFAAIPNKIVLTGFLFYSVPLLLESLSASESEIGRVMMIYSLVIVFLGPWLSRFADERGLSWSLIFAGTLISGLGMALLWARNDIWGVVAAVTVIAIAHAASISPQVALVPDICKEEIERVGQTTVLGLLRMIERVGSVVGPLLVAAFVARFGFVDGLSLIGLGIVALSLPLLLTLRSRTRET